ncbi:MAG: hypothetical protein ABIO40_08025 [Devosia sp.]
MQSWLTTVLSFFVAPASLIRGDIQLLPIVATLGLACLLVGVTLAIAWHVSQAWWLVIAAIVASVTPITIGFSNSVLGWMGMLFAVLGGAIFFLVNTAVIASGSDRRLPIWLIGVALTIFAYYTAAIAGAFISLTG